jgi:hypothetical protein
MSVRPAGSESTRAVTSEQASHASGPTSQPHVVKKWLPSATASRAERTATSAVCISALRTRSERLIRPLSLLRRCS